MTSGKHTRCPPYEKRSPFEAWQYFKRLSSSPIDYVLYDRSSSLNIGGRYFWVAWQCRYKDGEVRHVASNYIRLAHRKIDASTDVSKGFGQLTYPEKLLLWTICEYEFEYVHLIAPIWYYHLNGAPGLVRGHQIGVVGKRLRMRGLILRTYEKDYTTRFTLTAPGRAMAETVTPDVLRDNGPFKLERLAAE